MGEDTTVTIDLAWYEELLDRSRKLACLEAGGVDNWEGYDLAMEVYREDEDA